MLLLAQIDTFITSVLPLMLAITPFFDWLAFKGLRRVFLSSEFLCPHWRWVKWVWLVPTGLFLTVFFGHSVARMLGLASNDVVFMRLFGAYAVIYSFKVSVALFVGLEDIWMWACRQRRHLMPPAQLRDGQAPTSDAETAQPPLTLPDANRLSRRAFLSKAGLAMGLVPFYFLSRGIIAGRYDFQVHRHAIRSRHLPLAFDGLRIVQLSDFHVGSFDDPDKVAHGLRLALAQKPDLILFTGDIVNARSEELEPWQGLFSELKAPMGVFSVLGNHDYGLYHDWDSEADLKADAQRLLDMQREMGYHVLRNEHVLLSRGTSNIALLGSENWGRRNRVKRGDLALATAGLPSEDIFKLLMTHDPTHWGSHALPSPTRFDLTLSGHTHGMQLGVVIGDLEWSPIAWHYPHWAGLYRESGQWLNVNRGFGYALYPGRVGVLPEITVLTLERG